MILTVTIVSSLDEVIEFPLMESTSRVRQLERKQKVVDLLKVGANRVDLVDQILHAHNSILAQLLLDDLVVRDGDTLLIDLSVATLIDEFSDALQVRIAVRNVRVRNRQHLLCRFGQAHKCAAVELQETQELHDLARLGWDVVDTGKGN